MRRRKFHRKKEFRRSDRYGRQISYKSGEGMNLDTLFLSGRIDDATYIRYLREFEEQQRHGRGRKAIARIVDGKTYYEMSDKEDYFYGGLNFDDWCLYHPFEDVCDAAAEHLPIHDYRNDIIRETASGRIVRNIAYNAPIAVHGERWMPSGSMTMPPPDSQFDESLDDYLKGVEERPQTAL